MIPLLADPSAFEAAVDLPADGGRTNSPVVGGRDSNGRSWPGIAAIYIDGYVECTGVLIAPNVVLTAGHCAEGITGVSLNASDIGGLRAEIAAERVVAYPKWLRTYDLALVFLADDAVAAPAVLAQGCVIDQWLKSGNAVDLVGYGATDKWEEEYTDLLQAGATTIIDPECTDTSRGCHPAISPGGELSAGGNGVDTCAGDSGGPLYLRTDAGIFLAGITSRAFDDARLPCSEGGIYVRPDAVIDWIEAQIGMELAAPDCDALAAEGDAAERAITSMSYEVGVCGVVETRGGAWVVPLVMLGAGRRRRG